MKICFLIINFFPYRGGAENNCYYLARELAKKHEVHVFCSGENDMEETIEGIKVHRSKITKRYSYYLTFYPSMIEKLLSIKFDLIHVHGFGFIQNDRAIKRYMDKYPDTKLVCTPHGPFMALQNYSLPKRLFRLFYMPFVRKSVSRFDLIFKVNPFQDKWMIKDYSLNDEKIRFLPNGIPEETFELIDKKIKEKIRDKYALDRKLLISYVGRIQKYKGLDQIIKVLPKLLQVKKEIIFIGMGKDEENETSRLKDLASQLNVENNVLFTGIVSDEEKNAVLEISNIFAFPSEWEAFGIGTLEAMAKGNAVISSRTEGGLYLIDEGINGYLFDYGNTDQLLEKMKLLFDEKKIELIKKNNISKSKKFIWSDIAKDLERTYQELV